jgi:hypothetical protein
MNIIGHLRSVAGPIGAVSRITRRNSPLGWKARSKRDAVRLVAATGFRNRGLKRTWPRPGWQVAV